MSRQLRSILVIMLLLFGLYAGTGKTFALDHKQPVSCSEATKISASDGTQLIGCGEEQQYQTCSSDGSFSFFLIKSDLDTHNGPFHIIPYSIVEIDLRGATIPPDTPPPIS
ncbi:hypothetical protein SAMN04488056_112116 [Cohaesibacter marisflavi]|uniref:Uncharacterized protein n=1 Tax=Cohaesibacter marisflavi TaxID=655353 RepID=A0A1I5JWC8_9HYPH|nr:hypothetical protein [Cohaesibacter marisflavi]SFO76666.1 hypothetical protein SAMN04488056_112116 [Cohaesibacter marisflavi]